MATGIHKGDLISLSNVPGVREGQQFMVTKVQPFVAGDLTIRFDIEPYPPIMDPPHSYFEENMKSIQEEADGPTIPEQIRRGFIPFKGL